MFRRLLLLLVIFLPSIGRSQEAHNPEPFVVWLENFKQEARQQQIPQALLQEAFKGVAPLPRVIEMDRKQPEGTLTFDEYIAKVVPDARVRKAQALYRENRALLKAVSAHYGVQSEYMVALWGIESNFGEVTGNFSTISALATLAYDGRRSSYFRGELLKALRILNEGHISVSAMKGSWAGAMGQSQFMPSSFLSFAVDENADGRKDIWGTRTDVFGSIANYLSTEGWNGDIPWGFRVSVPTGFNAAPFLASKEPKTLDEWARLGVRALGENISGGTKATLVTTSKDSSEPPYYLVTSNYQVILKWNRSRYFATAVGMLADEIKEEVAE